MKVKYIGKNYQAEMFITPNKRAWGLICEGDIFEIKKWCNIDSVVTKDGWWICDADSRWFAENFVIVNNKVSTWEAIKLLTEGKKVRRASWEEKNDYIFLDEKGSLKHSNGNRYRLEHHISRDDWEEYVEGVK